jgi:hypothetical protein
MNTEAAVNKYAAASVTQDGRSAHGNKLPENASLRSKKFARIIFKNEPG